MRRMLCGWTTKNYNRLAAALVGEIKKDIAHADTVLQNRLAAETAPANRWPRDDDLHAALRNKDMYGQRRQDRLVMVLWRIEEHLRNADNKVEQGLAAPSKLTLEHLIPQSWESHWPLDESQDDPTAWRNIHLHRLGNLTLTTGPLNSSLSNLPWHAPHEPKDKRRSLVQHSLLKLNTTVVHDYPEHFDEHSVDQRGAHLTELITWLWPGPQPEPATAAQAATHRQHGEGVAATTTAVPHRPTDVRPAAPGRPADVTPGAPQRPTGVSADATRREKIRELLRQGWTVGQIGRADTTDSRGTWLMAFVEEARLAGELIDGEPAPEDAVRLRDERSLRWEAVAARLYADARRGDDAQSLYDQAKGPGAAKRSYTGRGRQFPDMDR